VLTKINLSAQVESPGPGDTPCDTCNHAIQSPDWSSNGANEDYVLEQTGTPGCYNFCVGICPCPETDVSGVKIYFDPSIAECLVNGFITITETSISGGTTTHPNIQIDPTANIPFDYNFPYFFNSDYCYSYCVEFCGIKPECYGRCFPITIELKTANPGCKSTATNGYKESGNICLGNGTSNTYYDGISLSNSKIISPNPASHNITLNLQKFLLFNSFQIKIVNNLGIDMYNNSNSRSVKETISTENWSNGIYSLVVLSQGHIISSEKIVILH